VGEGELTVEEFEAGRARNRERLGAAVAAIVPELSQDQS
jgi:Na+-transporting methylmalonyl-CoA/oxaloacetate decarboxylase gamma subunit